MTKTGILLVGAGGHALSCIQLLEATEKYKILGLIGAKDQIGDKFEGYEVIGSEDDVRIYKKLTKKLILGIGQIKSSELRERIVQFYLKNGFEFSSLISDTAKVARGTQIGEGTVIMHNAFLNLGVKVGKYSIVNSGAILEHGAQIGDFTHISTGAIINGDVKIGDKTFIGSGSVVREKTLIGGNCLVSIGQVVYEDLPDNMKLIK